MSEQPAGPGRPAADAEEAIARGDARRVGPPFHEADPADGHPGPAGAHLPDPWSPHPHPRAQAGRAQGDQPRGDRAQADQWPEGRWQGDPAGRRPPGRLGTAVRVLQPNARGTARTVAVATVVLVLVAGGIWLAWGIRSILLTIFVGLFLAVGFDPVIGALQRLLRHRGLAVAVFVVLLLGLLALFGYLAVRPAVDQLVQLAQAIPGWVRDAQNTDTRLGRFLSRPEVANRLQDAVTSLGQSLPQRAAQSVGAVFGVVGAVLGGVVRVLAVLALMVYFMLAMPRMRHYAGAAVGGGDRAVVLRAALDKVGGYVVGQSTICAAAGISAAVFFLVAGVPYAAVLALSVAVLDAIPQVGATLGAVVSTLVALTDSLGLAIATLAFFVVYQQLENYVIAPRLFARSVDLSALAVLVAVLIGASLAGVVGALLALPLTAAGKTVLAYAFRDRLAAIHEMSARDAGERP